MKTKNKPKRKPRTVGKSTSKKTTLKKPKIYGMPSTIVTLPAAPGQNIQVTSTSGTGTKVCVCVYFVGTDSQTVTVSGPHPGSTYTFYTAGANGTTLLTQFDGVGGGTVGAQSFNIPDTRSSISISAVDLNAGNPYTAVLSEPLDYPNTNKQGLSITTFSNNGNYAVVTVIDVGITS